MQPSDSHPKPPAPSFGDVMASFGSWASRQPFQMVLTFGVLGTFIYYFAFYKVFMNGVQSTMMWAEKGWNAENDLQHGPLILPAALFIAWTHRGEIIAAAKKPGWAGFFILLFGIFVFVLSVWTLQPRLALVALPLLIFGAVWFLFGWSVARQIGFPCAFLLFMIPAGFVLGHTEPLQRFVASVVFGICKILHLGIDRDGVKLLAADGSFQCEVAGGCSGIRSLMAMSMLSALYVHFTQDALWKKVLIFCAALPFAVLGNVFRVFSVVLVSKFVNPEIGTGPWHDLSGFVVTIPIAVLSMLAFANLLNRDWQKVGATMLQPETPAKDGTKASPISYDY